MHALVDWLNLGSIFRHPGSKEDLRTCLYSSHAPHLCLSPWIHQKSDHLWISSRRLQNFNCVVVEVQARAPGQTCWKRERESVHCTSTNFHPDSTPAKHNQVIINLLYIHLNINFCKQNFPLIASYFYKQWRVTSAVLRNWDPNWNNRQDSRRVQLGRRSYGWCLTVHTQSGCDFKSCVFQICLIWISCIFVELVDYGMSKLKMQQNSTVCHKGPSIYYVIQIWGPERPPPSPL